MTMEVITVDSEVYQLFAVARMPLDAHELQRLLKSLEHWVTDIFVVFCSCCHSVYLRLNLV